MTLGGANLLILDEPTNHLDVESIEALEDALDGYGGSVLIVSHDRELLRGQTTRVWVLHDCRITDFDGSFGEWEIVSREREHAAAVRSSEAEALKRVKERQAVAPRQRPERDARASQRKAQERVTKAEAEIARLEAAVAELTDALEDPELYLRPNGAADAAKQGVRLETLRRELDLALAEWAVASEALEEGG
jgi:ATP-binding cassette subfamily F protein 3